MIALMAIYFDMKDIEHIVDTKISGKLRVSGSLSQLGWSFSILQKVAVYILLLLNIKSRAQLLRTVFLAVGSPPAASRRSHSAMLFTEACHQRSHEESEYKLKVLTKYLHTFVAFQTKIIV